MEESPPFSRPPLVLIANAEEWTARSLETILGPSGYAVVRAYTGAHALELAAGIAPDAVLIDAKMPDLDGVELCRRMRANPLVGETTPILLTTSDGLGRAGMLGAYDAGVWECLRFPIDGDVLLLRLRNFIQARRAVGAMRAESFVDPTSGLYSLRGLTHRVQEMAADAARRHGPLACVAIAPEAATDDLARGAAMLEQVAAQVAEHVAHALRRHGRTSDVIGRLSQFEFGLLTPTAERDGVLAMVERLRGVLDAQPAVVEGRERPVRLKVGYALVGDFATASIDALGLILQASRALQHAKALGEARAVVAYDDVRLGILN